MFDVGLKLDFGVYTHRERRRKEVYLTWGNKRVGAYGYCLDLPGGGGAKLGATKQYTGQLT